MNNHLSGGFFAIHDKLMIFIKKMLEYYSTIEYNNTQIHKQGI